MSFLPSQPKLDLKALLKTEPSLGVPFAEYHEALLRGPSPFSIAERELMAAYVSALNACDFCHGEHGAVAERFGIKAGLLDELLHDVETADLDAKLKPVFKYLKKLTETPARMIQSDVTAILDADWDEAAIYHAASLCGLFSFDNRLIQGMGIPAHNPEKLANTVERLHEHGYSKTVAYIKGEWNPDNSNE